MLQSGEYASQRLRRQGLSIASAVKEAFRSFRRDTVSVGWLVSHPADMRLYAVAHVVLRNDLRSGAREYHSSTAILACANVAACFPLP